MSAVFAPHRFVVVQNDIVERTKFCALSATYALVRHGKFVRLDDVLEKPIVDKRRHDSVIQIASRLCKALAFIDCFDGFFDGRLCFFDNLFGMLLVGRVKQSDIVFWHDDTFHTHVFEPFILAKLDDVFLRIADFSSAIQHKPRSFFSRKRRFFHKIAYDSRHTPTVSRRDENKSVLHFDLRMVIAFYLCV